MAESGGNTLLASVIEGDDTTVAQRQLDFTLALLTGDFTGYGAVYLVGEPVFTGDGLKLEDSF